MMKNQMIRSGIPTAIHTLVEGMFPLCKSPQYPPEKQLRLLQDAIQMELLRIFSHADYAKNFSTRWLRSNGTREISPLLATVLCNLSHDNGSVHAPDADLIFKAVYRFGYISKVRARHIKRLQALLHEDDDPAYQSLSYDLDRFIAAHPQLDGHTDRQ